MAFEWSDDVAQADWIGPRLAPFMSGQVTSVVPSGFAAYARILHPATDDEGTREVRWADVGARTGLELRPGAGFAEIALLPQTGHDPDPALDLVAPQEGTLGRSDAAALAGLLRAHTTTPWDCWFCLWDGYGWETSSSWSMVWEAAGGAARPQDALASEPPSVPPEVLGGPRVHLPDRPDRRQLLYRGEVDAALAFCESDQLTPNLWWPADRAWCVGTDLWADETYVGGSRELVAAVLGDRRLEAQPAEPGGPMGGTRFEVPAWLAEQIEIAVQQVLTGEDGVLRTNRGTVTTSLTPPSTQRRGELTTTTLRADGSPKGTGTTYPADLDGLADEVRSSLIGGVTDLLR